MLLGKMCHSYYKFFGEKDNAGLKSVLSKTRYPVITIVLYFNDERGWNSPKNLDEFISDYKITVFDIGGMTMEEASVFKSDFREIAEHFIKVRNGGEYVPSERTITHVDEFLKLMLAISGDRDYEKLIIKNNSNDKEDVNVCRVLQEAIGKGKRYGEAFAIEEAIKMNYTSMEQYNINKLVLHNK